MSQTKTSGPVECYPFFFLVPCRRPRAHAPTEILVRRFKAVGPDAWKINRQIGNRSAFELIAVAPSNAGWETHVAPGDGSHKTEHEIQPEELLQDLIRITATRTIGAEDYLVIDSTMPFYFRPVGRSDGAPALATGISLQIVGDAASEFVWVDPDELLAGERGTQNAGSEIAGICRNGSWRRTSL